MSFSLLRMRRVFVFAYWTCVNLCAYCSSRFDWLVKGVRINIDADNSGHLETRAAKPRRWCSSDWLMTPHPHPTRFGFLECIAMASGLRAVRHMCSSVCSSFIRRFLCACVCYHPVCCSLQKHRIRRAIQLATQHFVHFPVFCWRVFLSLSSLSRFLCTCVWIFCHEPTHTNTNTHIIWMHL